MSALSFSDNSLVGTNQLTQLRQHQQQLKQSRRWKHSAKMGHKLQTLDEMAHRNEREAAEERRKKKKERKDAKKSGKKHDEHDKPATASTTANNELEEIDDNDLFLDDDEDYGDDDNMEGDEDAEPSLPNPEEVKERMMNVINKFQESLKSIRGAEPTPEMFDDVQVNAYGSMTPLKAVGQVVIASPTLAQISCFDPAIAKDVQKAIQLALELNPQVEEGGMVRVPLPRVSMEVREQTAKQLNKKAESCKQRLRQVRRKAMDVIKKGKDGKLEGISKDDAFASGKEIENITEQVMDKLKAVVDEKMNSIMAV
jgi:ribosome recycling factor